MKILIIQHDAADKSAAFGEIATAAGHKLHTICLDRGDVIPADTDAELLATFGGGISFTKGELPDWVHQELALVQTFADSGRRALGICLGSQLIATAMGAKVRRNDEPEVGWHPVESVDAQSTSLADVFTEPLIPFHWHQDTFGIPPGATHLFRSAACENQGYLLDDRIVGLQFHLEANEKTVQTFLAVSSLWRQDAIYVQTEQEVTAGIKRYLPKQQAVLERLVQWLTRPL